MPGNGRAEKGIDLDGGQSFLGGRSEMRRPEVPQVQGGPGMRMRTERESRVQLRQGLRSTRNPHDKVTTDKLDPVMLFPAVELHKTSNSLPRGKCVRGQSDMPEQPDWEGLDPAATASSAGGFSSFYFSRPVW